MQVATVVTRRHLAFARTLAEGFREHHPSGRLTVLVADAEPGELDEPFDVLTIGEIGLDAAEIAHRRAIYGEKELACSLKPPLLLHLLGAGADAVVYFDADIRILGSHEDVHAAALEHGIVLTRHIHQPADDGLERQLLQTGAFQGGLLAVSAGATAFLHWWAERTARDCRDDPSAAVYFDQRWLELVPSLYDHHVLTDRGVNVISQGLESRSLEIDGDGYRIGGTPVRSFHFGGGFDPDHPLGAVRNALTVATRPSRIPAFARLMREYRDALLRNGWRETSALTPRFASFASGIELDPTMRRAYREQLLRARDTGAPLPPDPFGADGGAAFLAWLAEPVDHRREAVRVPRYLYELRADRPDLLSRFPDLVSGRATQYLQYVDAHLPGVPSALRESSAEETPYAPEGPFELLPGLNVVGAEENGALGVLDAADAAGIEHVAVAWSPDDDRRTVGTDRAANAVYDVNVIALEDADVPDFNYDLGVTFRPWRYTIAYWDREPGPATGPALPLLDEVWTTSARLATVLADWTEKPITVIPRAIPAADVRPAPASAGRRSLGIAVDLQGDASIAVDRVRRALDAAESLGEPVEIVVAMAGAGANLVEAERVHAWAADRPLVSVAEVAGERAAIELLGGLDGYLETAGRLDGRAVLLAVTAAGVPSISSRDALDPEIAGAVVVGLDDWEPGTLAGALRAWAESPDRCHARTVEAAALIAGRHSPEAVGGSIARRLEELTSAGLIPVGPRGDRPPALQVEGQA